MLAASSVEQIVVTDTHPAVARDRCAASGRKLVQVSAASLFAEAIRRLHDGGRSSELPRLTERPRSGLLRSGVQRSMWLAGEPQVIARLRRPLRRVGSAGSFRCQIAIFARTQAR